MLNSVKTLIFAMLLMAFIQNSAASGKATMRDDNPSYCDLVGDLAKGDAPDYCPKEIRGNTRGGLKNKSSGRIAFSKLINFDYDSDKLRPESTETLELLARVLNDDKLRNKTIHIEGHTDQKGSRAYNMGLSKRRALSVKRYLVSRGVKASRLIVKGYSFDRLHDPEHPYDAINRRVEFFNPN